MKGVSFNYFTSKDVVRHPLVARIIEAYEADEAPTEARALAEPVARASPSSSADEGPPSTPEDIWAGTMRYAGGRRPMDLVET